MKNAEFWRSPWLLYVAPCATALLLFLVAGGYFLQKEQFRQQERRLFALEEASAHAKRVEHVVGQAVAAPGLLATLLRNTRELHRFEEASARVLQFNPDITTLRIAPGGSTWRTFANPERGTRSSSVAPPPVPAGPEATLNPVGSTTLTISASELVSSQPIHARSANETWHFWGYAIATVSAADLSAATRTENLSKEGFDYELSYRRRGAAETTVLSRSTTLALANAIVQAVPLPSGDSIEISLLPRGGWTRDPFFFGEIALAAAASLLAGILLHFILRQPSLMYEQVDSRSDDLQRANATLRQSKALLDLIFERLPLMLVLKRSDDLKILRVNRFAEALLGRENAEIINRQIDQVVAPDLANRINSADLQAVVDRVAVDLPEIELAVPEGIRTLNLRVIPLLAANGDVEHILEVAEDVTERKQLSEGIARQIGFLEQMIDSIPASIFLTDTESRYLNVNREYEKLIGKGRDELVGTTVQMVSASKLADRYQAADRRLLADGTAQSFEGTVDCADGKRRDVLFHRAVFRDRNDRIAGIIGVILDISERVTAERRIDQINRTFAVLSGINEATVRASESRALLDRACEILVERGQFPLAWVYFITDDGGYEITNVKGLSANIAERTLSAIDSGPARDSLPGRSIETHHYFWPDAGSDNEEIALIARDNGLASLAIMPIKTEEGCVGGIGIYAAADDAFSDDEQKLLDDLADDISHALITIRHNEQRQIAEDKLRLAARVFENSSEGIMITGAENQILAVNKTFTEVTGYTAEEVIGQNPRLLSSGQQSPAFYREMWLSIHKRGDWHGEVQNRRKNGEFYSEWLTISAVKNEAGEVTNYVAVFSDITSNKQIEERLNFLANFDTLTSLPNRVLFSDRLAQAIGKARDEGRNVAVMFLDLDRFSLINETFGHSGGDFVLVEIAKRLQASVRKSDSVSRLGGDQFAVILPDLDSPDEAAPVAGKIMHALSEKLMIEGQDVYASASIGISVFPDDGDDVEALVRNADSAMYRAMEEGHNTFCFYHQEMNARSSERMSLEADLRTALEKGELEMHYQPFIDARTGRIVGAEALLRWHRPGIGYITPAAFIPLLEETGMILQVGEWALRTACIDNAKWRAVSPELFVAVNFSAMQLADENIVRRVGDLLTELGFPSRHLEIELTESMVMRDAAKGIRTLNGFREIGTKLSVDDFGTGYSSLAYLKRLPIDTLKIDRSFITDTPTESEANAIVQAIIAMGHSLKLNIIAEGVQEERQAAFLKHAQCDLMQGFYFSAAVNQGNFLDLISQPHRSWGGSLWPAESRPG